MCIADRASSIRGCVFVVPLCASVGPGLFFSCKEKRESCGLEISGRMALAQVFWPCGACAGLFPLYHFTFCGIHCKAGAWGFYMEGGEGNSFAYGLHRVKNKQKVLPRHVFEARRIFGTGRTFTFTIMPEVTVVDEF
eukprot:RCo049787